jgi:hypothetical protein
MAEREDNPFKAAKPRAEDGARLAPFRNVAKRPSLPKQDQMRTIEDLNIADPAVLARNPRVAKLTVRDLNDLADQFAGIPSSNPVVGELTIEDMQDIEGVFLEFKLNTARDLAQGQAELVSVDVSCCCTCPCCCCAASDVDPIRA